MNLSISGVDWKIALATALLMLAAMPVQIYAVPGFEITPSLVLAAAALLLFDPTEKLHYVVVAFLGFCGLLALAGMYGPEGPMRNILGSASYSSGAPYILVGMLFARRDYSLSKMYQVISPVVLAMSLILLIDLYLTNGAIVDNGSYGTTAYAAQETVFVDSFFPFYGTYAVITLATITMLIGAIALGSLDSFASPILKTIVLACSSFLLFVAFTMWTRQVVLGVIVFYLVLIPMTFRRKEVWASAAIFLILFSPLVFFTPSQESEDPTGIATYRIDRAVENIEAGDVNKLSTGRMAIYQDALVRVSPRIILAGCGFCNLKSVMDFDFSSLHNVPMNAIYKGGIIYAVLYVGTAFWGLLVLWSMKNTLARNVTIATLVSLAVQSTVNDVLFFQVVPAIMFSITGYLLALNKKEAWRHSKT
jgi:hypothetical protein